MSKRPKKAEQLEFGWNSSQFPLADRLIAQIREKRFPSLEPTPFNRHRKVPTNGHDSCLDEGPTFLTATPEALARLVWRQIARGIYRARSLDETRS
jgi:hypothetical protein